MSTSLSKPNLQECPSQNRQSNSEEAFDARPLGCGNIRSIVRFLASAFERTADVRSEVR